MQNPYILTSYKMKFAVYKVSHNKWYVQSSRRFYMQKKIENVNKIFSNEASFLIIFILKMLEARVYFTKVQFNESYYRCPTCLYTMYKSNNLYSEILFS